jgi:Flp pilus assembly protein protease CpaA
MIQALNLALKIAISLLLVYAAVMDVRKREVPYVAGIGLMLFGGFALIWNQHWMLVLFYFAAVLGSRGGIFGLLPIIIALVSFGVPGLIGEAYPFILAILFVITMFQFKAIGSGDAVLAFGLLAIAYESKLWMPLVLLGSSMIGIVPLLWKRSPKEIFERTKKILTNFGKSEEDEEAVLFPWAVIAAVIGLVYVWLVRGEIL